MIDPNEAPEGYIAQEPEYIDHQGEGHCGGCGFFVKDCPEEVSCMYYDRKDKSEVIFIKKDDLK